MGHADVRYPDCIEMEKECLALFYVNSPRQVDWIGQTVLAGWIVSHLNLIIVKCLLSLHYLLCVRFYR